MQKNAKTPRSHRRAKWIGGIAGLLAVILAAGLLLWQLVHHRHKRAMHS